MNTPTTDQVDATATPADWSRLSGASWFVFGMYLVAALAIFLILSRGLDTNINLTDRLQFIVEQGSRWTAAWLTWNVAALSLLLFFVSLSSVHAHHRSADRSLLKFAVALATVAVATDLAAQAIEMGVVPDLASLTLSQLKSGSWTAASSATLTLAMHRLAMVLTGYVANGACALAVLAASWSTRESFPSSVFAGGLVVGTAGLFLTVASLMHAVAVEYWSGVVLILTMMIWQAGVAVAASERACQLEKGSA